MEKSGGTSGKIRRGISNKGFAVLSLAVIAVAVIVSLIVGSWGNDDKLQVDENGDPLPPGMVREADDQKKRHLIIAYNSFDTLVVRPGQKQKYFIALHDSVLSGLIVIPDHYEWWVIPDDAVKYSFTNRKEEISDWPGKPLEFGWQDRKFRARGKGSIKVFAMNR